MMSILNYFKRVPERDERLPEPNGSLSKSVPTNAIKLANAEVLKLKDKAPRDYRTGPYLMLTPAQRYEVGKRAAEHGVTASIRYFAKKYPKLPLKETSVRRFKNLYIAKAKGQGASSDHEVQELPRKKEGRPLLLPDELDYQAQEYIKELRKRGLPINTAVVVASAQGIVMNRNADLLSSSGTGGIKLTSDWAKSLLNRMGYVKRKACSKAKVDVAQFEQLKDDFLLEIKTIVSMDEIPPELVINFDQTALNYVPISHWTMDKEGVKRVEVVAKDDKRQLTAVLAGSLSGDFLPPQLIYEGKTDRCLPHYQFPSPWHVTKSETHWSNEQTMKEYFNKIIFPYIQEKKTALKLSNEQPALLIFDNFRAQCTSSVLDLLDGHNINVALIPPNCTDRLQPMDLSVNKAVKDFLRGQFREWYAKQVCAQLEEGENKMVDLRLSILKPLGAEWISLMHKHIQNNPTIVRNGFKAAGILESFSEVM